jgi:hypothetical protein
VAIVANMFTVRAVNLSDSFNFLGSPNMLTIAEKHGRWDPSRGLLDFTATFSFGEYAHKYYSGRRMWGGYRLMTDVELPDTYGNLTTDLVYNTTIPVWFIVCFAVACVGRLIHENVLRFLVLAGDSLVSAARPDDSASHIL